MFFYNIYHFKLIFQNEYFQNNINNIYFDQIHIILIVCYDKIIIIKSTSKELIFCIVYKIDNINYIIFF